MTSDLLSEILARKAEEIAQRSVAWPLAELRAQMADVGAPRGFIAAIERDISHGRAAVIAELKKASPSAGLLRTEFVPREIARDFAEHGATCLSVLTDTTYFHGRTQDITEVRNACRLPVLRKDFILDPYQIFETRCIGADAVLLIAAALDDPTLLELTELAHSLGLDVLLEVHDAHELTRALATSCRLIGINNRNLRTFETHLETTLTLCDSLPQHCILVTESGVREREDVLLLQQHHVHAFLVGETLMRALHPGEKLKQLFAL